ncbi:TerB family tellurite resistance protein [Rhizobium sp. SG2393]|uniref:tellurite resistance TerB family protein n=1 Tax=Rhizobium sp. SG2393 TaxID=3276279 RepID=UPI00366C42E3
MFDRLRSFIDSLTRPDASHSFTPDDPRVAVIALCMQVMEADGQIMDTERDTLRQVVREHYQLDDTTIEALIVAGETAEKEAIDYYHFTTLLNRSLSEEQKIELVGMLWEIVYADGNRSEMEDHALWRIGDLLGVSGRDRIVQRQQVASKLHLGEEKAETI